MNSTDLLQLVDNWQQAGKIHKLHQACDVCGCVVQLVDHSASISKNAGSIPVLVRYIIQLALCGYKACCKLPTDLYVDYFNRLVASCFNKSANDKLEQA